LAERTGGERGKHTQRERCGDKIIQAAGRELKRKRNRRSRRRIEFWDGVAVGADEIRDERDREKNSRRRASLARWIKHTDQQRVESGIERTGA
jgi:hypothetical protein